MDNGSLAKEVFIACVLKRGIIKDCIKLFDEIIERYESGNIFFKFKMLKNKFGAITYVLHFMECAGIIEKFSRTTWKIVDIESLKKLTALLKKYRDDYAEYMNALEKYSGDIFINGLQKLLYKVGRMIAEKEQGDVIDVMTSILVAYYIENYGEDPQIKRIIRDIELLKELDLK